MRRSLSGSAGVVVCAVLAVTLTGCGSLRQGAVHADATLLASAAPPPGAPVSDAPVAATPAAGVAVSAQAPASEGPVVSESPVTPPTSLAADREPDNDRGRTAIAPDAVDLRPSNERLAMAAQSDSVIAKPGEDVEVEDYDPWEPFNEKTFEFNRRLDKYVLKPVAKGWKTVVPEQVQIMIGNGFDNLDFIPRVVNNVLQWKWGGAGLELTRFLINSTAGIGGLFDPAKDYWKIGKNSADFGQTLGKWGNGPGPYLVLPFTEPLTVRDGIGKAVDGAMDPLSYVLPLIWTRLALKAGDTVNERALNYDLFQGFEESVIDMYSAVRHGYLQRRERMIRE